MGRLRYKWQVWRARRYNGPTYRTDYLPDALLRLEGEGWPPRFHLFRVRP